MPLRLKLSDQSTGQTMTVSPASADLFVFLTMKLTPIGVTVDADFEPATLSPAGFYGRQEGIRQEDAGRQRTRDAAWLNRALDRLMFLDLKGPIPRGRQ